MVKRLGEVVVSTDLEPDDPVDEVGLSRQHDQADIRVSADFPSQSQTVLSLEHQIKKHKINFFAFQRLAHFVAVLRFHDLVLCAGKDFSDRTTQVRLIINNENTGFRAQSLIFLY